MRITVANEFAAHAAVEVLRRYGYSASSQGCEIWSDCPVLLAIPALERALGLQALERVDLNGGTPPMRGRERGDGSCPSRSFDPTHAVPLGRYARQDCPDQGGAQA